MVDRIVISPFRIDIPETDLYTFIRPSLEQNRSKLAVIDKGQGQTLTYWDVDRRSAVIARQLYDLGLRRGDRLAIYSPNCAEFVLVIVASTRLALTLVTVNCLSTAGELKHYIYLADPKVLICSMATVNNAVEASRGTSVRTVLLIGKLPNAGHVTSLRTDVSDDSSELQPASMLPIDAERSSVDPVKDVMLIQFSSGTTGLPKAVMLSHSNVISKLYPLQRMSCYAIDSQYRVVYQPMSHIYGFDLTLWSLFAGDTLVVLNRFNLDTYLTAVQQYKVKEINIVPPIAVTIAKSDLSKYDLSSVTRIGCASAPLGRQTEVELLANKAFAGRRVQIFQVYGLTESCGIITYAPVENDEVRQTYGLHTFAPPGSCGNLFVNTQAQVVDPETGRILGPNETGEIWARGPQMMLGYLNNKAATEAMLKGQGWLATGDLGYYDKNGYFFIVDRAKELIKYKGFQVAPAELEALILSHPDVADVGVIGVPDEDAGELPQAWVVRKQQSVDATAQQIIDWTAERTSAYKKLRGGVVFVDVIPRSPTGKILRRQMRDSIKTSKL